MQIQPTGLNINREGKQTEAPNLVLVCLTGYFVASHNWVILEQPQFSSEPDSINKFIMIAWLLD